MAIEIRELSTRAELEDVYPLMKELRTDLRLQDYFGGYDMAKKADGYTLIGAYETGRCVSLMGYRILHDFVHGKHFYIDDLVTTEGSRSKGLGAKLLAFAETEAQRLGCTSLRLCTGVANDGGKRFYEREGWTFRSVVYKKKLASSRRV